MLRSIIWTVLFLSVLAVSAFGLLILLVSAKEGGETWQLVTGAGVFLVVLVLWWRLASGFEGRYNKTISTLGKAVLTTLFLFFTVMATPYVLASIQGPRFAEQARIENFTETAIEWPGFAGPVGLRLEWDLVHPFHEVGVLYPPKVWMGTFKRFDLPNAYFSLDFHYFKEGDTQPDARRLSVLESLPFGPMGDSDGLLSSERRTHLVYDLYPKNLVHLESSDKLCLNRDSFPINTSLKGPPVYHQGEDLSALWLFAGGSNLTVDLSPLLMNELRKQSRLQGRQREWKAMQKRFQPAGLRLAGYDPCRLEKGNLDFVKGRLCFCKNRRGRGPLRRAPLEVPVIKPKGMATLNAKPQPLDAVPSHKD